MHPKKRWMAVAIRDGKIWRLDEPELVGDTGALAYRLRERAKQRGSVMLGFDFPIGLPEAYGKLTGLDGFKDAISQFGDGAWREWFNVAERAEQIEVGRPFFPNKPGGARRSKLASALVIALPALTRECERQT